MVSDCQAAASTSISAVSSNGEADTEAETDGSHSQCKSTYLLQLQFVRSVLSVNPCVVSSARYTR